MLDNQEILLTPLKTILVVEDDINNAEVFEVVLASETPYQTLVMESGLEVLERIEEIKAVKPALFLFDYHLPAMTAFELYDLLHAMEELKNIPTLITSASHPGPIAYEIAKRGLTLIEKPFEVDTLLTTIKQILDTSSA
jgi:CheY-like chemotaxis protein